MSVAEPCDHVGCSHAPQQVHGHGENKNLGRPQLAQFHSDKDRDGQTVNIVALVARLGEANQYKTDQDSDRHQTARATHAADIAVRDASGAQDEDDHNR